MFRLFNKTENNVMRQQKWSQDKLAASIVKKCLELQLRWAHFMRRKAEGLTRRQTRYCFILFCTMAVAGSLYVIASSFRSSAKHSQPLEPINVPAHVTRKDGKDGFPFQQISKSELERIERFLRYVDNLGRSEQGQALRDRLLLSRPGLLDSIHMVEELYHLQSPKN